MENEEALYPVMNRGDRRESIVHGDREAEPFHQTVGGDCEKTQWLIHAFCLMPSRFHLAVETPDPISGRRNEMVARRLRMGSESNVRRPLSRKPKTA